jgi:hypothetical protein
MNIHDPTKTDLHVVSLVIEVTPGSVPDADVYVWFTNREGLRKYILGRHSWGNWSMVPNRTPYIAGWKPVRFGPAIVYSNRLPKEFDGGGTWTVAIVEHGADPDDPQHMLARGETGFAASDEVSQPAQLQDALSP